MGKVYSPPKELNNKIPKINDFFSAGKFDRVAYKQAEKSWSVELQRWCKQNSTDKYAGETINEPVADGCASYMVFKLKPIILIHMPLGDAYHFKWIHKLSASDIRKMIQQEKNLRKYLKPMELK